MPGKYDPSALWVALSEQSDGDLFSVYPKLLAELLLQEEAARQDGDTSEAEKLVLPSDKEYRLKLYFYMVSMQKTLEDDEVEMAHVKPAEDPSEEWAPWALVVSTNNPRAPPPVAVKHVPGPVWDIGQVMKAARLLRKPPLDVTFVDEQEMRCVYSIIYDVFRYKTILDQAIEDVEFFTDFPQYAEHHYTVWLFLMELARRRWGARAREESLRAEVLLKEAGWPMKDIERELWQQRVHFAASIARIRIKNRALSLIELLPAHLRDERITACANKITVTGWVNTFKAKKVALLIKELSELGYSYSNSQQLCAGEYRFDRVCPRFITLRPPENVSIGQLDLVKNGVIVLQEREFCEGASTLCRALRVHALSGVVAQTHASSPRCSAYLAAQLKELAAVLKGQAPPAPVIPELGRLVVFGAGDKVASYVLALRELGIEASEMPQSDAPVCVISEQVYCDTPTVINALDGVVAALATPPNSYSAVTDPIDLVCGRGGDLAMLEILTESEMDPNGRARVQSILEEQKKTLRTLMSKPQIQLILYETHSALEAENQAQVTRAVAEANRLARDRHTLLKRKTRHHSPQKHTGDPSAIDSGATLETDMISAESENSDAVDDTKTSSKQPSNSPENNNRSRPQSEDISTKTRGSRPGTNKARPIPEMPQLDRDTAVPKDPDQENPDVYVPDCDLFEVGTLPNLDNGLDINCILFRDGCYLGLIQRKEVTRLDAKFMIRVAEERGLFGATVAAPPPVNRRKRADQGATEGRRQKRKGSGFEVERVAAPTYASQSRSSRRGSDSACDFPCHHVCERNARRHAAAAAFSAAACTCDGRHSLAVVSQTDIANNRSKRNRVAGQQLNLRCSTATTTFRNRYRHGSLDTTLNDTHTAPHDTPCRRLFPIVVHELHLKPMTPNKSMICALLPAALNKPK